MFLTKRLKNYTRTAFLRYKSALAKKKVKKTKNRRQKNVDLRGIGLHFFQLLLVENAPIPRKSTFFIVFFLFSRVLLIFSLCARNQTVVLFSDMGKIFDDVPKTCKKGREGDVAHVIVRKLISSA